MKVPCHIFFAISSVKVNYIFTFRLVVRLTTCMCNCITAYYSGIILILAFSLQLWKCIYYPIGLEKYSIFLYPFVYSYRADLSKLIQTDPFLENSADNRKQSGARAEQLEFSSKQIVSDRAEGNNQSILRRKRVEASEKMRRIIVDQEDQRGVEQK